MTDSGYRQAQGRMPKRRYNPGVYASLLPGYIPPGIHHPVHPASRVHPVYTTLPQQHAGCIRQPACAGDGALGSKRLKALGEESFCASERRKCLSSCASARRIACSARVRLDKDWIDGGCYKAQSALEHWPRRGWAHS